MCWEAALGESIFEIHLVVPHIAISVTYSILDMVLYSYFISIFLDLKKQYAIQN